MIGECIDQIGDVSKHPYGKREWPPAHQVKDLTVYHGYRAEGHGGGGNFKKYHEEHKFEDGRKPYPLFYATDQRMEMSQQFQKKDGSPTGYHCEITTISTVSVSSVSVEG